jgi:hypothetical protein
MRRIKYIAPVLAILCIADLRAGNEEESRKRAERKLTSLEARAKRLASAPSPSEVFLQQETRRLLERCRTFAPASYKFDRMLEALDDLLDARDDLLAATAQGQARPKKEEDDRRDTAKSLERSYFRVQQGDYFARLSADEHAKEYVALSRQLYQRARASYDTRDYRRAGKLASASSELVNVLENLAQAAVRKLDPPVLN